MEIKTRSMSSRLSRSHHIFLRENPHLKELFNKLQKEGIHSIEDLKPVEGNADWGSSCPYCGACFGDDYETYLKHVKKCEIYNRVRDIMIECEVNWRFNMQGIIPYLTFSNNSPLKGNFEEAIPKILKELGKL